MAIHLRRREVIIGLLGGTAAAFTIQHRKRIVDSAAQRRLPAICEAGEFVEAGGLISYGPNLLIIEQRAAEYVDKIFKGAKPSDLPVEQPTKFEMLINMKTATALQPLEFHNQSCYVLID